jgi:hypothetical protein
MNGFWMRVADRKFLITYVVFNYNDARTVVSIAKIRMATQIDTDGRALQGTQEVLAVDPDGQSAVHRPWRQPLHGQARR